MNEEDKIHINSFKFYDRNVKNGGGLMNYKERLKQYLEEDVIYSEYKNGKCDMSDFDKFCIEHCKDIECLLNEVEEQKEVIQTYETLLKTNIEENKQLKEENKELIDYLKEKKKEYKELYNKSCDIIDFDRYESLNILCEEILSKIEKEEI